VSCLSPGHQGPPAEAGAGFPVGSAAASRHRHQRLLHFVPLLEDLGQTRLHESAITPGCHHVEAAPGHLLRDTSDARDLPGLAKGRADPLNGVGMRPGCSCATPGFRPMLTPRS
jgi:hypothetical protein